VDGVDDFAGVDALEVDGGHAEVAVAELALDDVEWDAFARELDRVCVTSLMRREPSPDAGTHGAALERRSRGGRRPRATAGAAVDDAKQRPDGHRCSRVQPRLELLEPPIIHSDFAAVSALAAAHEDRSAARVEVELIEQQSLVNPKAGAPKRDDQAAGSCAV
jgi:hypothetical protein